MSNCKTMRISRLTLSDVEIDSPCPADLTLSPSDERIRFCDLCSKNVHNLSAMTEDEAADLIDTDEDLCVAYNQTEDGGIVFQSSRRASRIVRFFTVFASVGLGLGNLTGCGQTTDSATTKGNPGIIGKIATRTKRVLQDKTSRTRPMHAVAGGLASQRKRAKVHTKKGEDGAKHSRRNDG